MRNLRGLKLCGLGALQVDAISEPEGLEVEEEAAKWRGASTHAQCVKLFVRKNAPWTAAGQRFFWFRLPELFATLLPYPSHGLLGSGVVNSGAANRKRDCGVDC